ncbi:MAG: amino acid permease [Candidatus Omnitrophota bacterium]
MNRMSSTKTFARKIGLFGAIMVVVGNIIGTGIFTSTGFQAASLDSGFLILLTWVVGGIFAFTGALTYAELAASMPHSGGEYVYLKRAYSPIIGFLVGWTALFASFSASIALSSIAFAKYLANFSPWLGSSFVIFTVNIGNVFSFSINKGQLAGLLVVYCLTYINYIGIKWGSFIENVLTVLKILPLLLISIFAFAIGKGTMVNYENFWHYTAGYSVIGPFAVSLMFVIFTYSGWNGATYIASEIKNPQRNVPLALLLGTLITIGLYLLVNCVYLYALPLEEMKNVLDIGALAAISLFGRKMAVPINILILISILGCLNVMIMTGARIYFAMAKDKIFFDKIAHLHPKYITPHWALLLQAICVTVLIFSGTFEQLLIFTSFVIAMFSVLVGVSLIILRYKAPDMPRPFKCWGYPFVPIIFILSNILIVIIVFGQKPQESLFGIALVASGIPAYKLWSRRKKL